MRKNIIFPIVWLLLLTSCEQRPDIYDEVSLGSPLTTEMLKKAKQIVPYKADVLLVYEFLQDWKDQNERYILRYDSTCTLTDIAFFPGTYIDTIVAGRIEARKARKVKDYDPSYLPGYSLTLRSDIRGGTFGVAGIIQQIEIDSKTLGLRLYAHRYDSVVQEIDRNRDYNSNRPWPSWELPADTLFTSDIGKFETNYAPFEDKALQWVLKRNYDPKGGGNYTSEYYLNCMLFRDSLTRERFYDTLYARIQDRCRPIDR